MKDIRRQDFKDKERRQDEYGTSVITIQILKTGGVIKITNRYNHSVLYSDNTFNSNPDNIILGLSRLLKKYFNVDFSASEEPLPEGFSLIGNQIFKHHTERNNIYYGNQAWAENGVIHEVDKARGDALFDGFLFDGKTKTLKKIDPVFKDSFADDFNRDYGGNRGFTVDRNGNLTLDGKILIGTEQSRIKTINLPALTTAGNGFLRTANALTEVNLPALTTVGNYFLCDATALTEIDLPALTTAGSDFLDRPTSLKKVSLPALTMVGAYFLNETTDVTYCFAPLLDCAGIRESIRNLILQSSSNPTPLPQPSLP